jgi:hypothetical protein
VYKATVQQGVTLKLYVASSWRNTQQPSVVQALRKAGHEVYDFRHPEPGNDGFSWESIDPNWKKWDPFQFEQALRDPIARKGFKLDMDALDDADGCVLVLPCGRSAHLELGYAVGRRKFTAVLLDEKSEPELMYKMVDALCFSVEEAVEALEVERKAKLGIDPRQKALPL